jgi:hypothetical protein
VTGLYELRKTPCGDRCANGGNCLNLDNVDYVDLVGGLVEKFWGKQNTEAAYGNERRRANLEVIFKEHIPQADSNGRLSFMIPARDTGNVRICEASFLLMLGLISSRRASDAPRQWSDLRDTIVNPGKQKKRKPKASN